jgi:hypothetical protein
VQCEVDGLDSAVEWDDANGFAEQRGDWLADEVDDARGLRCTAERSFARLDTNGTGARGGKDAEEAVVTEGGRDVGDSTLTQYDARGSWRQRWPRCPWLLFSPTLVLTSSTRSTSIAFLDPVSPRSRHQVLRPLARLDRQPRPTV